MDTHTKKKKRFPVTQEQRRKPALARRGRCPPSSPISSAAAAATRSLKISSGFRTRHETHAPRCRRPNRTKHQTLAPPTHPPTPMAMGFERTEAQVGWRASRTWNPTLEEPIAAIAVSPPLSSSPPRRLPSSRVRNRDACGLEGSNQIGPGLVVSGSVSNRTLLDHHRPIIQIGRTTPSHVDEPRLYLSFPTSPPRS